MHAHLHEDPPHPAASRRFFAVLATGYVSYDQLAALARRTAEPIRVDQAPRRPRPSAPEPRDYATTNGKRRVYAERIDAGTCPRGGYSTIQRLSDTKVRVTWSRPNTKQQTKGTLKR